MGEYEDKIERCNEIIALFEKGNLGVDEMVAMFEEGTKLLEECQKMITKVQSNVEEHLQKFKSKIYN